MENLVTRPMFSGVFAGKRVWVSGHTGFKGAWLSEWLLRLGAEVFGFAQPPPTQPSLFECLELSERMHHGIGEIRDAGAVARSIRNADPDFVFHLAAMPLVRTSYRIPIETFETNVMGTAHVLEALRTCGGTRVAVLVTSDKCYENRGGVHAYREEDPLGGHDPYSASKAAAEIVIGAYRRSFFQHHPVRVASVRGGNVIGGGDWALDRIVPDCIRSLSRGEKIGVRNPSATRPWQHVLEPLSGYLWLAASMASRPLPGTFNFGPGRGANRNVRELVEELLKHWPGEWVDRSDPSAPHEAKLLMLSTRRAESELAWQPTWDFETAVAETVKWYRTSAGGGPMRDLTAGQIEAYESAAAAAGLPWRNGIAQ